MRSGLIGMMLVTAAVCASANDNGKAGRTSRLGEGCGDCHGATVSAATTVTIPGIGGTVEMTPGSSREFTVVVAHNALAVAGVGIAVHDAADGGANAGTIVAGTNVRIKGTTGELTHAEPVAMSGGAASFTFTWKAPEQAGTYYIQAIGNAANGDGAEDSRDQWAWMEPVQIVVSTTSGVDDLSGTPISAPSIAPMPIVSGLEATITGLQPGRNTILLTDMQGREVYRHTLDVATSTDRHPLGAPDLRVGIYGLAVITSERVVRSTLVVE